MSFNEPKINQQVGAVLKADVVELVESPEGGVSAEHILSALQRLAKGEIVLDSGKMGQLQKHLGSVGGLLARLNTGTGNLLAGAGDVLQQGAEITAKVAPEIGKLAAQGHIMSKVFGGKPIEGVKDAIAFWLFTKSGGHLAKELKSKLKELGVDLDATLGAQPA